jgi:ABC-2 type transport system permease protein
MTDTGLTAQPRMPSVARLLAAQVGYQARLLASGRAVTLGVIFPVILLIASHSRGTHITAADVAQYAVFGLSLTAWNTYGVRLVAAREAGVLKRWRATPLPRWCYFLGRVLATVVVATLAAAATVAVGVLLYHTHLSVDGALWALAVFVLGSFAWAATATAVTAAVPTVEAAAPTMMLIYFPVVIASGALGSISEPHWLSTLVSYLPAEPLVHAAGTALGYSAGHTWLPGRDVIVLAAWAIAGIAVSIVTFRWEPHRPTQRGSARSSRQVGSTSSRATGNASDAGAAPTTPPMQFESAIASDA